MQVIQLQLVLVEHHQPTVVTPLSLVQDFQRLPLLEEVREDIKVKMAVAVALVAVAVVLEVLQETVVQETQVHTLQ